MKAQIFFWVTNTRQSYLLPSESRRRERKDFSKGKSEGGMEENKGGQEKRKEEKEWKEEKGKKGRKGREETPEKLVLLGHTSSIPSIQPRNSHPHLKGVLYISAIHITNIADDARPHKYIHKAPDTRNPKQQTSTIQ